MTPKEIEAWLLRHDYQNRPQWPHIWYSLKRADSRYKLTTHGVRWEQRLGDGSWMRMRSGYYKNLSLTAEDKLSGMSSKGM